MSAMGLSSTRMRHEAALERVRAADPALIAGEAIGPNAMPMHRGLDGLVTPVTGGDEALIVKTYHAGALAPHGIAGAVEGARLAGERGVGPVFRALLPETQSLVTEALGPQWRQAGVGDVLAPARLAQLVAMLRAWHGSEAVAAAVPAGAMFHAAREVLVTLPAFHLPASFMMDIAQVAEWVEAIVAALAEADRPPVVLHGEGLLSNVMLSDEGGMTLVDFDRVTMGDPYRDLAAFTLDLAVDEAERAEIVALYEGRAARADEVARLTLHGLLEDASWAFWALAGEQSADRRGPELYKYAANRLARFRLQLGQVDIARLLREV